MIYIGRERVVSHAFFFKNKVYLGKIKTGRPSASLTITALPHENRQTYTQMTDNKRETRMGCKIIARIRLILTS